jgi:ketosteroid isomerase-like protein
MDQADATVFAEQWERAWNAHDLEGLLGHFSDDVIFRSPVAAQLLPGSAGVLRGKHELRDYWSKALGMLPELRFKVQGVYAGLDTVVINYLNHAGNRVCEVLTFDGPLVIAGQATYQTNAAAEASGLPG